jgi:hypothetical protein
MSFDPDERSPYNKKIPLPPVMIQQLDIVLTLGVLDKLQSDVLEGLQSIVMDRKPNSWMTVYLITFSMLVPTRNAAASSRTILTLPSVYA